MPTTEEENNTFSKCIDWFNEPATNTQKLIQQVGNVALAIWLNFPSTSIQGFYQNAPVVPVNNTFNPLQQPPHLNQSHLATHHHQHLPLPLNNVTKSDAFVESMTKDKKTTLLIWYTAVSIFTFTKLPSIIYSFVSFTTQKTGLSKHLPSCGPKQKKPQHELNADENSDNTKHKTQKTTWQKFNDISNIVSQISLFTLVISAIQLNNGNYTNSALDIFSEDKKNPFFNPNYPINNRSNPLSAPRVYGNFLYQYVDTNLLPNMQATRTNTAFGQLYLPVIMTLQPYYLIKGVLSFISLAIATHQTSCKKPNKKSVDTDYQPLNESPPHPPSKGKEEFANGRKMNTSGIDLEQQHIALIVKPKEKKNLKRTEPEPKKNCQILKSLWAQYAECLPFNAATGTLVIATSTLFWLFKNYNTKYATNQQCDFPAAWVWLDTCHGQSNAFTPQQLNISIPLITDPLIKKIIKLLKKHLVNASNASTFFTIEYNSYISEPLSLTSFYNTSSTTALKTATLINVNNTNREAIDILFETGRKAGNSNSFSIFAAAFMSTEIESIIPLMMNVLLISLVLPIVEAPIRSLLPNSCKHRLQKFTFTVNTATGIAITINSFFFMGMLSLLGAPSGINEEGLNWNRLDFIKELFTTLFDIAITIPNNTTSPNPRFFNDTYTSDIAATAQLISYSAVLFFVPTMILAISTCIFCCYNPSNNTIKPYSDDSDEDENDSNPNTPTPVGSPNIKFSNGRDRI
jgi:hypothetical protein